MNSSEYIANGPSTLVRASLVKYKIMAIGYWQIKLDEASSKLCAFNSPFVRNCFTRLLFPVFQKLMSQLFEDTEGTEAIVHNIPYWCGAEM